MQNMRDNEKIARKSHSVLAIRHNEAAEVNDPRMPDPVSRGYIRLQEANLASAKYQKLMVCYGAARSLTQLEKDMIRDTCRGRTFELVDVELPRDTFYKPV